LEGGQIKPPNWARSEYRNQQGLDPETGEFLRQRQGSDRISADGAEQSKARSLYDMTFSAPKKLYQLARASNSS
jgi:hypothetical protein